MTLQYEEMDMHAHVLARPDTYISSIHPVTATEYILADGNKISKQTITYTPALLRIFIEAISNVIDNAVRSKENNVPAKAIKIMITNREISVWNDGMWIPVEKWDGSSLYIPEKLFGKLLTSSNYNDAEERYTSGRNGVGIVCTNIMSSAFSVELNDPRTGQSYVQHWRDNMYTKDPPIIKKSKLKTGFTKVTWTADFKYFGLDGYSDDMIKLLSRYVYDTAMLSGVNTYLNNVKLPIHKFKEYANLYRAPANPPNEFMALSAESSEAILIPSDEYEHVTFVNGLYTRDGGVHLDSWMDSVFKPLTQKVNSKYKTKLNIRDIRPYFKIFVTCNIPNPEFESQSKNRLTSPKIKTSAVSSVQVSAIMKWDWIAKIERLVSDKETSILKQSERKRGNVRIEGLDSANKAGGKDSLKCSLILCEGLSAKTYAVLGIQKGIDFRDLGVLKGRDWFGILALRGVGKNVRNATKASISDNKEITNIIQSLGLQYGVDYTVESNYRQLRYGRVILLTDGDCDGSHIEGLLLNLFEVLFPSLVYRNNFLLSMKTPIIRIGNNIRFYNQIEFNDYIQTHPIPKNIKYYKGLGTSSESDVKETFGKKMIRYNYDEKASETLNKVFHKDYANTRKDWLLIPPVCTPDTNGIVNISEFIDNDLKLFSLDDCRRSLPHIMDGLKESQRKILYATILKNLTSTMKVAQLAGFVAERTNYHHGETCLFDTITRMAQDFVGSNNIPLLAKDGMFGSRSHNGKDAANARYIFTKLSKVTRYIFHPDDDDLLMYISSEGMLIEPEYYVPVLPMVLVNGVVSGIGTGWSTSIPSYNPVDIIKWIKDWLNGDSVHSGISPYYNNFAGTIKDIGNNRYETRGVVEVGENRTGLNTFKVRELPIGVWTDKYKEFLEELKDARKITKLLNYSTPDTIHFEITGSITEKDLRLSSIVSTSNLVLFGCDGALQKYKDVYHIMEEFCKTRLEYYTRRRSNTILQLTKEFNLNQSKLRFLKDVMTEKLVINKRDECDIISDMARNGYLKVDDGYTYLLNLPVSQFTNKKLTALMDKISLLKSRINALENTTDKDMWLSDLDMLI